MQKLSEEISFDGDHTHWLVEAVKGLEDRLEQSERTNQMLVEVLSDIIAQWDTPNWKLTEATGTFINRARNVLLEICAGKEPQ